MTRLIHLLAVLLCLAACARAPAPGDLPAEVLPLHVWPSQGPTRAVILALHGYGDAGDLTFEDAAQSLVGPRHRRLCPRPARLRRHRQPAHLARRRRAGRRRRALSRRDPRPPPGVPLVVVGHSMGGGVALAAAPEGLDADALVLAGPAITGGSGLSPVSAPPPARSPPRSADKRWTGEGFIDIRPTDNPAALARVAADPRHFGDPSSRDLYGLVELMDRAAAAAPAVRLPTLTLMGRPRRGAAPGTCPRRRTTPSPATPASSSIPTAGTGCSATSRPPGSGATSATSCSPPAGREADTLHDTADGSAPVGPFRPGPEPGQRPTARHAGGVPAARRAAASRPPAVVPLPSSRADAGFGTASPEGPCDSVV